MRLLGSYKSNLAPFHYEELLKLLEQAVELGEFSGNKTFDSDSVELLRKQAQEFGQLPIATAGQRVTDDSLNNPISLLRARFEALSRETTDFQARAALLLAVLEKDTALLDQLLAGAALEDWARLQPVLTDSARIQWDFGMGHGSVAGDIAPQDPTTAVEYETRPPVASFLMSDTGEKHAGIVPPATVRTSKVKSLTWTYVQNGQKEELYGEDWARLSLLEGRPRINFTITPKVDIILPRNTATIPFEISGSPASGSLPIFVRVFLHPRRASTTLTTADAVTADPVLNGSASNFITAKPLDKIYLEAYQSATPGADGTFRLRLAFYRADGTAVLDSVGGTLKVALPPVTPALDPERYSGTIQVPDVAGIAKAKIEAITENVTTGTWTVEDFRAHIPAFLGVKDINPDEVDIYSPTKSYFLTEDYEADETGQVTFLDVEDGLTLSVRFTELYPSYQCSVNEKDWSPLVMLDPDRPYPDNEKQFLPIEIAEDSNGDRVLFPITDELGVPVGLYVKLLDGPRSDYYFRVSTETDGARPGAEAMLEVEFDRPSYLNGVALAPFTNMPVRLVSFEVQGLTEDTRTQVYEGNTELDRPLTIRFPRQLVRRVFLKLFQENYTVKEHIEVASDKVRRDALAAIQSALPYSVRRPQRAVVKRHRGFQYDFGLENIVGQDWQFTLPGVFVSGPYAFSGAPEVMRFDADVLGSPEFYICFRAMDKNGVTQDVQLQGDVLSSGSCVVFPLAEALERSLVTDTDLYLKIVFRTADDMVERFLLQATKV